MRSVNLLPAELRPRIPGEGDPRVAWGVLGGLAVLLLMVVVAISYSNKATTLNDEAASIRAEAERRQAAVQVAPVRTDDVADEVRNRTLLVGGLAAVRFPWNHAMKDLSRSLPPDVTLDTIDASSAAAATSTAPAPGAEAEQSGPTLNLAGCTSGWVGYSRLLSWLREMPGVKDVESTTSTLGTATDESQGGDGKQVDRNKNCGPAPLNFALTVTYAPTTADLVGLPTPAAAAAPAGATASTTSATGTPAAAPAGG